MKNLIADLIDSVGHNASERFHCPLCRGYKSLSITKQDGIVKWNCFKLNCPIGKGGRETYLASMAEIRNRRGHTEAKEPLDIPTYLVYGNSSKKCLSLLNRTHCLEAYNKGWFDIAYDPKQDRICFLVKKDNKVVGIIGRACNPNTMPKVLNYKNSDPNTPFIVNDTKTLVLVEDCPSAASVTRIPHLTGMALLGTNLKQEYIDTVKLYDKVIVALDRDARKKTLDLSNRLKYYITNVSIWLLDRDIKDMSDEELNLSYGKYSNA